LLSRLRSEFNLTIVFIGHNLAVVGAIADRVAVMEQGRIVEIGAAGDLYRDPQAEYTRRLISAVPKLQGRRSEVRAS